MNIKRTTENLLSKVSLPGERGPGEPNTNPNRWVREHIQAVLDMTPQEIASMDQLSPEWISERLKLLGGTGQPLETRLFIAPASHQSSGAGLGNQSVILSRVGLTHARTKVIKEDGTIDHALLGRLKKFVESNGGSIGAKKLNHVLNEQLQPFSGGEIASFGMLERLATRLVLAPVEWGLLLAATGGQITTEDLDGLYDHSLFPKLRAQRAAVAVTDALAEGKLLAGSKHSSGVLGNEVKRLAEWAGGVPTGMDPVSVAKSAAAKLLEGASDDRIDALRSNQGFPIGRVGLATMKLLCPFGGVAPLKAQQPAQTPTA
jgi:hypothetical protein